MTAEGVKQGKPHGKASAVRKIRSSIVVVAVTGRQ